MRQVIWGWRRSSWDETSSRLVYFAADCYYHKSSADLRDSRLVIIRRGDNLNRLSQKARKIKHARVDFSKHKLSVCIGPIGAEDVRRVRRLGRTRRHAVRDLSHFHETPGWPVRLRELGRRHLRLVAYVGSGFSYEAGISTLPSIHRLFGVDEGPGTDFNLGITDPLLSALSKKTFSWFVSRVEAFHSRCARASPSPSHLRLKEAYRCGQVSLILTDNVDDIIERRLRIPTYPTRGDGLISEKYPRLNALRKAVKFGQHALLVVGVSADRRGIIESLGNVMPTIVVNPALPVSPHSKNLDYLEELGFDEEGRSNYGHVFIKRPARRCLSKVLSCLAG